METAEERRQRVVARRRELELRAAATSARKAKRRVQTDRQRRVNCMRALAHAQQLADVAVALRLNAAAARKQLIAADMTAQEVELFDFPLRQLTAVGLAVVQAVAALAAARADVVEAAALPPEHVHLIQAETTLLACRGWAADQAAKLAPERRSRTALAEMAVAVAKEWRVQIGRGHG